MRYVEVVRLVEDGRAKGYWLDPRGYVAVLPEVSHRLPVGARAFALDEGHFDFYGHRCVKDLRFVSLVDKGGGTWCLELDPSPWKHDLGLRITYQGVERSTLTPAGGASGCGTVLLDELLPDAGGVLHEIAFTGGVLVIVARDLEASWR